MSSLREVVKRNKLLYSALLPLVSRARDFKAGPVWTAKFYIKYLFRKLGVIPFDPILKKVEGIYNGQHKRAFIVATGPSLKTSDLDWLEEHDEVTFSVNGVYKIFNQTKWRPTYYVMDDYWVYKRWLESGVDIRFENECKKLAFLSEDMVRGLRYKPDKDRVGTVSMCYWDHWYNPDSRFMRYSKDIKYGHYDMFTVTSLCINLADYMGIEKIYLLGVDCNYNSGIMHVGEKQSDFGEKMQKNLIRIQNAHKRGYGTIAKEEPGLVYNATRGGALEVFPRVKMDDIISGEIDK